MDWKIALILLAGTLFCGGAAAFLLVKIVLRPKDDEMDSYHYEFEENSPQLARYEKWSRITLAATVTGMLLLFLSAVL